VTFPTYPGFNYSGDNSGFLVSLAGNELAVLQGNQTPEAMLFFDTSKLPGSS
jgi:hypothetical protein